MDEARFLDERILQTPAIALNQATKETDYLAQLAMQSLSVAFEGFIEENVDAKAKVDELNARCADLERRIVDYLIRISSNDVSYGDEKDHFRAAPRRQRYREDQRTCRQYHQIHR